MNAREEFETIAKICQRAEEMGIARGERITLVMDIENAHKTVGLRLNDWLEADNFNFAHDIIGIQNNMNRTTGELEAFFLPRFAKGEN